MSTTPRRALIVIDVQNEYASGRLPITFPPVDSALHQIGRAIDAARSAGIPVIVVQQNGPVKTAPFAPDSDGWQLHRVIAERPFDHHVFKTLPGALTETGLDPWLRERKIDTLTVAGFMTHNCDAATVFDAVHRGFVVEFLSDASGSLAYENAAGRAEAEEIHRVFCVVFQSRFAAVARTDAWIEAVK